MMKSKRVSRIISALLVVMLVASLGITTVSANNHDDTEFTFAFNSASPLSWTAVREKTDSTSMYARISTMDGAYYVVCYMQLPLVPVEHKWLLLMSQRS